MYITKYGNLKKQCLKVFCTEEEWFHLDYDVNIHLKVYYASVLSFCSPFSIFFSHCLYLHIANEKLLVPKSCSFELCILQQSKKL